MKKSTKIIIIIAVILLVIGVYFLKNGLNNSPASISDSKPSAEVAIPAIEEAEKAVPEAKEETELKTSEEKSEESEIIEKEESEAIAKEKPAVEKEKTARVPMEFTVWNDEELLGSGLPTMLDFGSASCGPCQMMKPDLIAFYEESYGKVNVRYADVWADPSLTGGLPVSAVPTQYFFNADGTPYMPSEEMQRKLRFMMYANRLTEEHVLTAHVGILSKEDMKAIFSEMGVEI